jgi:transcriptional regulator with XRE-family HTH domain
MEARKRLKAWIVLHTNQREFAKDIGIDESYLSQVLAGLRTPRLPILGRIERETGIPVGGWVPSTHGTSAPQRRNTRKTANVGAAQTGEANG